MSSPMSINRSTSSTSLSSTMSISASPASPKYIPVHRRTPSNGSTAASSSRPSSPMNVEFAALPEVSPGVYSFDALLALRPMADESIKNVLRETCPEVIMNHRQKKSIQYLSNHPQTRGVNHKQYQLALPESCETPIGAMPSAFTSVKHSQRSLPRRNRSGRGPERRRSVLQDTWQGMRITARQPLMVL